MSHSIWRPFSQMKTALPPMRVKSAKQANLYLEDGRKIIDAISSWWVITHGHCEPRIVKAIQKQTEKIDQVLYANFDHEVGEKLIESLSSFLPMSLNKYFFSDNGSTSVEVALKMLMQYWKLKGETNRSTFLSFECAYHGDTIGAMSVGGPTVFTSPYKDYLFPVIHLKQGQRSIDPLAKYTSHLKEVLKEQGNNIAGLILEPIIQGAGGMVIWPVEALEEIKSLLDEYQIPIIFDEVMTGFGRTGKLFAFEHLSFTPDILCLSKGLTGGILPLALTIATEEIYNTFLSSEKGKMFFHGHSFTGNPITCAAALANLEIIKNDPIEVKWQKIAKIHQKRISRYSNSDKIIDKRTFGTIAAIEVRDQVSGYNSTLSEDFKNFSLEKGVFLRPLGNVIYILPPYSITENELEYVWDIIDEGIDLLVSS